jgi:hypothetical protein
MLAVSLRCEKIDQSITYSAEYNVRMTGAHATVTKYVSDLSLINGLIVIMLWGLNLQKKFLFQHPGDWHWGWPNLMTWFDLLNPIHGFVDEQGDVTTEIIFTATIVLGA